MLGNWNSLWQIAKRKSYVSYSNLSCNLLPRILRSKQWPNWSIFFETNILAFDHVKIPVQDEYLYISIAGAPNQLSVHAGTCKWVALGILLASYTQSYPYPIATWWFRWINVWTWVCSTFTTLQYFWSLLALRCLMAKLWLSSVTPCITPPIAAWFHMQTGMWLLGLSFILLVWQSENFAFNLSCIFLFVYLYLWGTNKEPTDKGSHILLPF